MNPSILGCAVALPEHRYHQADLLEALERLWSKRHYNLDRLRAFHSRLQVESRCLALPKEEYFSLNSFGERNRAFQKVGLELAERCVNQALSSCGLQPSDISLICFTTVTGLAVPSLEARLMNRIPFRPDLKRMPLFGLGCLGGAAGVARVADYLRGHPGQYALLLSVELCSLTLQEGDLSVANLISSGLFGDGAACVVMGPGDGPQVVDSRAVFFPDSENVMGWDIDERGFTVVLSPDVPRYASDHLVPALRGFLAEHGLSPADVDGWIAHPGGPKVIEAMEQGLGISLDVTRRSLASIGNLSSASVLFILKDFLEARDREKDVWWALLAMGPAFCGEAVLIRKHRDKV